MFTTRMTVLAATTVALLAATAGVAQAQEQGRVISSQPVVQQVAVPRQVCSNQQVVVEGQKSGAGGLMGAIAGGAIGSNVGSGSGRALASMIGFIGGAAMGDRIEGNAPSQVQNVQNCTTQNFYENRTAGYNVVYEFGGKQYNVQMPNDPGQYVQLQVTPVGASQPQAMGNTQNMGIPAPVIQPAPMMQPIVQQPMVQQQVVATPQVVYAQPQVVYQQPTVVYQRPYYPVIYPAVSIGFGYRGGYGHRRWH